MHTNCYNRVYISMTSRNHMPKQSWLFIAISSLFLSACAATTSDPAPQTDVAVAPPVAQPAKIDEITEYGAFTQDQLFQAIISELGAQRGELLESGEGYFDLAFETRDIQIVERAVQFASLNADTNALLQLGLLWSEVEPNSPRPHLMLAFQFLEAGNFDQALSHMGRVIKKGGDFDFTALAARTGRLPANVRIGLIASLRNLVEDNPDQPSMRTALIQLLAQNAQFDDAIREMNILQSASEMTPNLILLRAQIEQSMENETAALRTLRGGVRKFADDQNLRMGLARLYIQMDDFENAQEQFELMMKDNPEDWETLYSIALLDMEMTNYDAAIVRLNQLIAADQRVDESEYYLGYIFEETKDIANAIEHYRQVRIGTANFLAAQQQATRLSIQAGQLDQAHDWLTSLSRGQPRLDIVLTTIESGLLLQNGHTDRAKDLLDNALNRYPNDTDLLFSRVLLFDSIKDREGSETDLRQIILMKPDDARALNHLGYMLADQTDRHAEALELVERAIAITPDDPAVIDSLAWAQYKMGMYEEALVNLRKAFANFPDHEVASHLGEVLWMMGRKDEARQVWADALVDRPDSELIKEVTERLQNSE